MRPDWWPKWLPNWCGYRHELGPGRISWSWVQCPCAGGQGHHVAYCRADGCRWHMYPPEHVGPQPSPR